MTIMLLKKSTLRENVMLNIGGSKSISNRLLILKHLFQSVSIKNLSSSQDTQLLAHALVSQDYTVDIHHAGTAMRFLTSYFAIQERKTVILTGSSRMKQRPIQDLVQALQTLGAEITYLENPGFPPLKIIGTNLKKSEVEISARISSQFITSLLLIAGKLPSGLKIHLLGKITSRSYIEMTLETLNALGILSEFVENTITVQPFNENLTGQKKFEVESDWSSASYFYSFAAIGRKKIRMTSFFRNSSQGDAAVTQIYAEYFGIKTLFEPDHSEITLIPEEDFVLPKHIILDMNNCPDIVQTVCVTAAALKIPFSISGLETLKVKETDRLKALHAELQKLGCSTVISENSIQSTLFGMPDAHISIKTYQDHRMAMSFAPFCLIQEMTLEDKNVVEKSYPEFWRHVGQLLH